MVVVVKFTIFPSNHQSELPKTVLTKCPSDQMDCSNIKRIECCRNQTGVFCYDLHFVALVCAGCWTRCDATEVMIVKRPTLFDEDGPKGVKKNYTPGQLEPYCLDGGHLRSSFEGNFVLIIDK